MDIEGSTALIQLALVVRAFFFIVVFLFAGWMTIKTNPHNHKSVNILGIILIGIGLFNVFMMYQWIALFYL